MDLRGMTREQRLSFLDGMMAAMGLTRVAGGDSDGGDDKNDKGSDDSWRPQCTSDPMS